MASMHRAQQRKESVEQQDQLVFSNKFALTSKIQEIKAAGDAAGTLAAIQRLSAFVNANHLSLEPSQVDKLGTIADGKKSSGAWNDEVGTAYDALFKDIKNAKNHMDGIKMGRKVATQDTLKKAGVDADDIRNEHIDPYEPVKPGRKVYCRIDRQVGVTSNTYKMYLETVTADLEDETVDQFREEFMFAAVRKKTSMNTNYHIYDSEFMKGKYCGKVRGLSGMMDRDKKFEIFDSGTTAFSDRSALRRAGNVATNAVRAAPGAAASAAYQAPGAIAKGTVATVNAVSTGVATGAEVAAVGAKKTVKMVKRGSAAFAKGTRNSLAGAANLVNNMQYSGVSQNSKPTGEAETKAEDPGANPMLAGKGKDVPKISKFATGEEDEEAKAGYKETDLVLTAEGQGNQSAKKDIKAESRDGETIFQTEEEEEEDEGLRKELGYVSVTASENLNRVLLLCHTRDKPDLDTDVETGKVDTLFEAYNKDHNNTFHLKNRLPTWNPTSRIWSLGFEGVDRVVLASSKNFVFENDQDNQVYMQFGKKYSNAFTLDFRYPMTPYNAFTFAMSFFEL